MSYLVYARKYRPMTFEEMVDQKVVVQTLQNAIKNDRVAQAYIFSGMRGVGKTTAARILAKALNCQDGPVPTPCNTCDNCQEINDDRSVDVIEIDGASNTGVDDVRSLREGVQYKPIHCRYKVIIIDEIHMLSKSAFNALLKTLEEPPPSTVFIFATTEFHKVPATIVSRCQHFEFKGIPLADMIAHLGKIAKLENISVTDLGLNLIATAAEGSLRDAQSLLDQAVAFSGETVKDEDLQEILGTINRDILFRYSSAILEERPDAIFPLVEDVIGSGYDLRFFYEGLIQHFRNLLLVRSVKAPGGLLPLGDEDTRKLKVEAAKASPEELLRYLNALQQAEQGLRFTSHPRFFLEVTLVKLCHFRKIIPLQKLLSNFKGIKTDSAPTPPTQKKLPSTGNGTTERTEPVKNISSPPPVNKREEVQRDIPKTESAGTPSTNTESTDMESPKTEKVHIKNADEALEDPAVKNFMETFKAQILSVERKKGEKVAAGDFKDLSD
ncbi:MAG: DNA polymerase III subunit gamma/tau [Candidatus Aminicenantes bacterium]|nr:DNA polymerase III subunit gamma/tau [Candidatus Aminicenantes bacterium]